MCRLKGMLYLQLAGQVALEPAWDRLAGVLVHKAVLAYRVALVEAPKGSEVAACLRRELGRIEALFRDQFPGS